MKGIIFAALSLLGATAFGQAGPFPLNSNLTFYGASSYHVESSTPAETPVLLAVGKGYFFGADCSSGSAGGYGQLFDLASASNVTALTKGSALSPAIFTSADGLGGAVITTTFAVNGSSSVATAFGAQASGHYEVPGGSARFTNGAVALKHLGGSTMACHFKILTDAAIKAGGH